MLKTLALLLVGVIYTNAASFSNKTYVYKTVGDLDILADVYIPSKSSYIRYPVLLATHGGGYVMGDRTIGLLDQSLREAMDRGWLVISIDYRLSPSVLIDEIMSDVEDAYVWVRTELVKNISIDLDRITVYGWSAGGGIALINGYKLSPRPRVVVAFYPFCANFNDLYSYNPETPLPNSFVELANTLRQPHSGDIASNSPDLRGQLFLEGLASQKIGWLYATKDPNLPADEVKRKLIEFSAVYNVDANYPPTYISHGLADSLVPYNQTSQLVSQLELKGVKYKVDLVPGADHCFEFVPDYWENHVLPMFDFIDYYMINNSYSLSIFYQVMIFIVFLAIYIL